MSTIWDLPPTSGSIIWAKQVERQLNTYMKRVEDVLGEFCFQFLLRMLQVLKLSLLVILGKGWENHVEGQKLKSDGDSFRLK